jgi:hypothetical protein
VSSPNGYVDEVVSPLKVQLPNSTVNVATMQLDETCITHKGTSQDRGLHAIVSSKNKL